MEDCYGYDFQVISCYDYSHHFSPLIKLITAAATTMAITK
jgi:hypothetical protein